MITKVLTLGILINVLLFAGIINLDFSNLSGLSQMNKDLNNMVEMQKALDKLPIILSENNSSTIQEENNGLNTTKPISNAEFTASIIKESEVLEKQLKKAYQDFLDKHQKDKLFYSKIISSQKMWIKHREAELEMAFPHVNDSNYSWSGLSACYTQYKNNLTKQRIQLLKTLDKTLDKTGCTSYKTF